MKFIISLLFVFVSFSVVAADQLPPQPLETCKAQAPYGMPQLKLAHSDLICRHAYLTFVDDDALIPAWESYVLLPEHTTGCVKRGNSFAADQSIVNGRAAQPKDYKKTNGYDTGHIANDADMEWDPVVEKESRILDNVAPQLAGFNRGIWKRLETAVRAWADERRHPMVIYAGPVYDVTKDKKIGPDGVVVPDAFWKIVVDQTTGEVAAYIFEHTITVDEDHKDTYESPSNDLADYLTTVANIEARTGIKFSLPAGADKNAKGTVWAYSTKQMAADKKSACTIH